MLGRIVTMIVVHEQWWYRYSFAESMCDSDRLKLRWPGVDKKEQ